MAENNGPKFNFIFLPPTPWLLMSKVYSSVCLSQSTIEPQNRCVRYFWDIFQPLGCAHWVFGIKYWCQLIKTRFCDAKKDGLQITALVHTPVLISLADFLAMLRKYCLGDQPPIRALEISLVIQL